MKLTSSVLLLATLPAWATQELLGPGDPPAEVAAFRKAEDALRVAQQLRH